ncbi:hypothetical protein [Streptomyces spectabilis]|uniref:Uncharacterized protein n=1 Tax=Streptomyces spectabilis TaxID=68270 RepID=A0A516RF86_STRST|nr:hypothetical protein [Streptomyces spectabilis]QDQ14313.1 hypothetical protein FH965_30170 [Streptomyces spectabilis]
MATIKFATVGKGGTVHGTTDEAKTLCGKDVAQMVNLPGAAIACKACKTQAKKIETEESADVAKNTETKSADTTYEEVRNDVRQMIDVLNGLTKNDAEKIKATFDQGQEELKKLTASKRAGLTMELKRAKADAEGRSTASTAIVLKAETTSVDQIEGYREIVDSTAEKMAAGIRSEVDAQQSARTLAEAILDARLRVIDKKGRPDLKGSRQTSKDMTADIKATAANKLVQSGFRSNIADTDDLMDSLQGKIEYQMSALLPEFVRALDNDTERFAELFPMLTDKVTEETPASEILFKEYNINPESVAERRARKRAEAKALANATGETKELGAGGEGEDGEGEGEGSEGAETKSLFDKDTKALASVSKILTDVVKHSEDYTSDESDKIRKQLTDALGEFSAALAKL